VIVRNATSIHLRGRRRRHTESHDSGLGHRVAGGGPAVCLGATICGSRWRGRRQSESRPRLQSMPSTSPAPTPRLSSPSCPFWHERNFTATGTTGIVLIGISHAASLEAYEMTESLTPRQRDFTQTVAALSRRRGIPPTLAEVAAELEVSLARSIQLADQCQARGVVTRERRVARSLRVIDRKEPRP
jgi:hypothetical protein